MIDFIKDADCTKETPVKLGVPDAPIYGKGIKLKPRVDGRTDSEHFKKIYLPELLPLEEYDLIVVLISGGKDSVACYLKLLELGVPKERIEFWHHDIDGGHPSRRMDWKCTQNYVKALADAEGIKLRVSYRVNGFFGELYRIGASEPIEWIDPDLLYVGRSTNKKLESLGIRTIGGLAQMDEKILQSRLGKMGAVLWAFANGYDDSPVKRENTSAPIKSIGNSTTTPKELETDEDVKIMLYILSESVAARLRENGFRCRTVEISIRDNELYSFTRQCKLDNASNITGEIASMAYRLFKANYRWDKPIRSVGVRGADLVNDNYMEQLDLFCDFQMREKQMKMDVAVDDIRRRFGFYSIQRGLMYRDRALSAVNAKEDHTVHPHGYFG